MPISPPGQISGTVAEPGDLALGLFSELYLSGRGATLGPIWCGGI